MNMTYKQPYILLIRSPFTLSSGTFRVWAHGLTTSSPSASHQYQICDAASDFLKQVLINPEALCSLIKGASPLANNKAPEAANQRAVQKGLDTVSSFATDPRRLHRILGLGHLESLEAHDDITLLMDLRFLDAVLDLMSNAFSPCRLHRHGFSHPSLNNADDLLQFSNRSESNPFHHYAHKLWQPLQDGQQPDGALLYVDAPGQMGPAVTLVSAWRIRWPETPIRLVGPATAIHDIEDLFSRSSRQISSQDNVLKADIEHLANAFSSSNLVQSRTSDQSDTCMVDGPMELRPEQMPAVIEQATQQDCRFIAWEATDYPLDLVTPHLYTASRQGIWNHLTLNRGATSDLEKFAAANANIVHSYCRREDALSKFSDPTLKFPGTSKSYGRTQIMPGRPLWMVLQDGALIRYFLEHYSLKSLMRLRVRKDGGRLFEVGKNLTYHYQSPGDLPEGHLDEIVRMVEAGGSVNTRFVQHNLERAYLIAYVEEEGVIVGNSSLKHPRDEYMDAVSQQSGIDLHNFLERGYTSVRPEYRGLGVGAKLLEGLTKRAGEYKIFSVIAEGNIATQKMAIRNRTRRVATFYSHKAKKEVSVWIPEWMLPEGIKLPPQPDPDAEDSSEKGRV